MCEAPSDSELPTLATAVALRALHINTTNAAAGPPKTTTSYNDMDKKKANLPFAVGITGGIGAGKTYVAQYFKQLGIAVYSADEAAKNLINNNLDLKKSIIQLLGADAYCADGRYNSPWVSQQIFTNPALLTCLNMLVHPAVLRDALAWHNRQTGAYTLREAALLVQSGHVAHLDYLIVVVAPQTERIARVQARSGLSVGQIEARMAAQLSDKEMITHADFMINNSNTASVEEQVQYIHKVLTARHRLT